MGRERGDFGLPGKKVRNIQRQAAEIVARQHQERDAIREQRKIDRVVETSVSRHNPEADIIRRLDRKGVFGEHYTGDPVFDAKVAKPLNDARPQYGDFKDVYPLAEIRADQADVQRIERSPTYQSERGSGPVAFEYSIVQGVKNGMLGEGVTASLSSKYDDVKRKLDGIIGFPSRDGRTRHYVGIDVTTSDDSAILDAKLAATATMLRQKKTSEAKFFIDHDNPQIRGPKPLPRAVLSVDRLVAEQAQKSLSQNPDYDLETTMGEEITEELELQLTQGALFLLERFYGPSATKVQDAEELLLYWQLEQENIRKYDPELYNAALLHIQPLEDIVELQKKNNPSESVTNPAGAFLTSLRRRVY